MIQRREIALAIVLSLVTCGIYGIYWFIKITDDAKLAADDTNFQSGGVAFLLTLVTFGIYGIYWAYKMGELMKTAQQKHNLPVKDNAVLYLVLALIGLGIVDYILIQSDLNAIADLNKAS